VSSYDLSNNIALQRLLIHNKRVYLNILICVNFYCVTVTIFNCFVSGCDIAINSTAETSDGILQNIVHCHIGLRSVQSVKRTKVTMNRRPRINVFPTNKRMDELQIINTYRA
jgi:hypothetical protein